MTRLPLRCSRSADLVVHSVADEPGATRRSAPVGTDEVEKDSTSIS